MPNYFKVSDSDSSKYEAKGCSSS